MNNEPRASSGGHDSAFAGCERSKPTTAGYGQSADPKPYIDFRNAYPINFAWSHPAVTFNGVTNAFLPVTTLRLGLNEAAFAQRPDLTQGVQRLPPLAQRLHVEFATDARFDNPRAVQIRLPGFDLE